MEGARLWERVHLRETDAARTVIANVQGHDRRNSIVEDPGPTVHAQRNPLQKEHSISEVEAISVHLKRSLESVVLTILDQARTSRLLVSDVVDDKTSHDPLRIRWVEAFFPFTSPSWELEVFWQGEWLELLGCGVIKQSILDQAGKAGEAGWAFGMGLERVAMLMYSIPDIRLFWSQDERFLSQFVDGQPIRAFMPFSRYPGCPRDVAFWTPEGLLRIDGMATDAGFHENDVMQVIRDVGGDLVEYARNVDTFQHPESGRKSLCYNINYRSLERVISREEANALHDDVRHALVTRLGVELR